MAKWRVTDRASRRPRIAAVASLSDPARLALYELVSRSEDAVSKDAAAAAVGLSRSTTGFHLDRLAEEGLVQVEFRRTSGRTGPGSGRPAKLYRRADNEVSVSLPERHYDVVADVLARGIEISLETGAGIADALEQVAQDAGRTFAEGAESLDESLERSGFEPIREGNDVVLGNCPFAALAREHSELVCHVNRHLVEGMRAETHDPRAVLSDPGAGRCCVRVTP